MDKARAAREANRATAESGRDTERQSAPHPADANRPRAFFTLGEKRKQGKGADAGDAKAQPGKDEKEPPRGLTLDEMRSFRDKLVSMLVSLWELADKGLTVTAAEVLDGEEAFIWRSIDDDDTAFLADRILAKGRENPYVGAQVRALVDHWTDARMVAIIGPRLLESAGWYQAHGLRIAVAGVNIPPRGKGRQRGQRGSNGHQAGYQPTQPYQPTGTEGAMYGAQ